MQYLLGIDVGTTGTKALLFSETGRLLGHAYRAYPTATPAPGWSEQNPEDWWRAVCETVREVCHDPQTARRVAAISLSTQGGTMAPVDSALRPVRPAIVWNDSRGEAQKTAFLRETGDAETMYQKTGWQLEGGLNACQIRWMRDNEPELFAKTAYFLSVPDYISAKLTGIPAVDLSNAGINQLADIRAGQYDAELLSFAGVSEDRLAKIVPSGQVIGYLTKEAAQTLGLSLDCVLVSGAHDQYAVALGAGANRAGDILIGSGTAWVVTAIADEPDFSSGLAQSVAAVPGKWGSIWSLSSGGVCLEWLRKNLFSAEGMLPDYDQINTEASKRKAAESGLFFFPFSGQAGEGRVFRRAAFTGLDLSHDQFDLARAVMEGVAFQIVWMLESFRAKPSQNGLILAGGASKSPLWTQLVADIAGLPVRIPEVPDLACVGAAILAGAGSGGFSSVEEGCRRLAMQARTVLPDPDRTKQYRVWMEQYRNAAALLCKV